MSLAVLASITKDMARELAVNAGVCVRPLVRRVLDRDTGTESRVPIACGSTREAVCPPCARKARVLRMQQCQEGWHRDHRTRPPTARPEPTTRPGPGDDEDQDDDDEPGEGSRRVRSTRRRSDAPDLPRVPMERARSAGRSSRRDGRECRPSMFLTLTLPSYGPVRRAGVPVDPASMTTGGPRWTRCTSRSWSTGSCRTCAAAPATGCSTSPPSNPRPGWRRTCTWRSAAPSRGRCSAR